MRWRPLLAPSLAVLVLSLAGCSLLNPSRSQPRAQVKSLQAPANKPPGSESINILQQQVMRFADLYATTVAQASDDFSSSVATPEARLNALRWKLGQSTAAFINASDPNPTLNVLDMLVLATLSRIVVEDYYARKFGAAAQPWLETQRRLEADSWTLADSVLKPDQQQELRGMIQEWRRKNPNQRYIGAVRFREFASALGEMPRPGNAARSSIFSLLYLDPLASLDPTAATIEQTRLLGERAMFYSQRLPTLLSWQTELLAYQLAGQPEAQQMLSDATRLSAAALSVANTARQIPVLVDQQREAAIQQVLNGLASQQTNMSRLLSDTRETFNAGNQLAVSVNDATRSLDEFVRYVYTPTNRQTTTATNRRRFDVRDYGNAATQVGAAAIKLNTLLATVNQSAPQLAKLGQQTAADAQHLMNHAFWLALTLILVLLIGSVAAGLAYRWLANLSNVHKHFESKP
ncbi:MAG TPA: hypothetical protein VMF08_12170 [Candidatus Sulfotelmatobacter sp.]|nr:hypothetical protein [Candidatus Sulfotelmatobacter sp.]